MKAITKVVLLGRPNVGKSSIFNALTRTSAALVAPEAGVTRDWREGQIILEDDDPRHVAIIDTAGVAEGVDELADQMSGIARKQAEAADVVLFILDGKDGLLPSDEVLVQHARTLNKPTLVVVNKADVKASAETEWHAEELGLGPVFMVSAAHDMGFSYVKDAILTFAPEINESDIPVDLQLEEVGEIEAGKPLPLAIVGRPNAGKSTLINTLTGTNRLMTGPLAGLTRESLEIEWESKTGKDDGQKYILVDTPGQRRQAKVIEDLEQMSVSTAKTAVRMAAVVVLVIDVSEYAEDVGIDSVFHQQDISIAQQVLDAGRPLIILLNKWDQVTGKDQAAKTLRDEIDYKLFDISNVTMLTTSGLTGKGVDKLLPNIKKVYETWSKKAGTSMLNRLLEAILLAKTPPLSKGYPVRLKYISQVGICPPRFAVWGSRVEALPNSYKRFILNQLREILDLHGIPVRLDFKASKNPYAGKRSTGKKAEQLEKKRNRRG